MKKSTYTRTALASLLTLSSFSCFAADFSNGSMRQMNKQENTESMKTSGKIEVMNTSNKKLKEKMDRICNAEPRKKAEEQKKENARLAPVKDVKSKAESIAKPIVEKSKEVAKDVARTAKVTTKKVKETKKAVTSAASDKLKSAKDTVKSAVNKANPVVSVGGVDIFDTNPGKSNLRITFGGVANVQSYGKFSHDGEDYKRYNVMAGKYAKYYEVASDKIKGSNPLFPSGIGNIGDYSDGLGMKADTILHMRAENKNEDLGLLYGADVQFHVPVTEGKSASQGVYSVKGRGAHMFINSEYGDVKLGYQFGPEALMRLDATRIAAADGGADSGWFRQVNLEGAAANFPFYVTPRLYTESFSSESEKLSFRMAGKYNKGVMTTLPFRVAYYSPKYMGARFGLSYAPHYESSLFSVNDSIAVGTNPYVAKIDEITDKFLEAGKIDAPVSITDVTVRTNAKISGDTIPEANRTAALTAMAKAIDKELVAKANAAAVINADTALNKYKTTYSVRSIDDAAAEAIMAKPTDYNDDIKLKAKIEEKLTGSAASGNLQVATLTSAVNAVLADINKLDNSGAKAAVKAKVEEAFKEPVFSRIISGSWDGSDLRHVGPDYEHIVSAGVSYEYDFDEYKVKVKGAAVGELGFAKEPSAAKHVYNEYAEYNNLMGINLGISADYEIDAIQSVKFAASFAHLGKSGQPKGIQVLGTTKYEDLAKKDPTDPRILGLKAQFEGDDKDTIYWTAGAGYQRENIYTSLTYFGSKMNDGDYLHDVALGVQYDLSPACSKSKFVPYAALHYFVTNEKQFTDHKITKTGGGDVKPNKGALLLTGVKFSF
ncbi:MAG: hypothetical protein PG981_001509 [Wolbachia endosymbiont of Ctenocephalides orientis wCori]|nr:MAG: hypothetical protein PG981_001509 [Wolbachia endosymbiont of Ctenocephalides orientis wCori]